MKQILIILTLTCPLVGQESSQHLLNLVASERAFAAATAELGIRNGFLTFFADDALAFEPTIGPYAATLLTRPEPIYPLGFILRWAPEEGAASRAGDIGYLTGPYTVEGRADGAEPSAAGWYFSIWKKQTDGTWKVFIDVGIETPLHGISIDSVLFEPASSEGIPGIEDPQKAVEALLAADASLNGGLRSPADVVPLFMDSTVRYHRNGWYPIVGHREVSSFLRSDPYLTASTHNGDVSSSTDLGYTYGSYTTRRTSGYYVRAWRWSGTWKVVLDVTTEAKTAVAE
jgi:hypothetical protein